MKIAIISDIHDNLVNLKRCLAWCRAENVKQLICCGDITNRETLSFLADNFKGNIHLVRGNIEIYDESEVKQYDHIKYYGEIGRLEINNKKIGLCHEPYLINKIIERDPVDIIFYGHTHKPWESQKGRVKIVNPGTLAGLFQKATFAVWDTNNNKLELKILENL